MARRLWKNGSHALWKYFLINSFINCVDFINLWIASINYCSGPLLLAQCDIHWRNRLACICTVLFSSFQLHVFVFLPQRRILRTRSLQKSDIAAASRDGWCFLLSFTSIFEFICRREFNWTWRRAKAGESVLLIIIIANCSEYLSNIFLRYLCLKHNQCNNNDDDNNVSRNSM